MIKPFSLFVGLRYSLARKRNLLLSFVSLISMLGISLGVLILIIAVSVINGSIDTLRREALKSVPHVTVSGATIENNWQAYLEQANASADVLAVAPYIEGEVLLRYQGVDQFIRLRGIDASLEAAVVDNPSSHYRDMLAALGSNEANVVLGTQLASSLGVFGQAELSAISLRSLLSRDLSSRRGITVIGFADFGVYANDNIALVNLAMAEQLLGSDAEIRLRIKVADVFRAQEIAEDFIRAAESESVALPGSGAQSTELQDIQIVPWNVAQASLFNALNMEKYLTGFMLLMIVLIGAVNIVSTLVMVVADKNADIAILRTMGASRPVIMAIFIIQGMIAGMIGTVIGVLFGVVLADNISAISLWFEQLLNSILTGSDIYLLSHLRTEIYWQEVGLIAGAALAISFLATLYPAYRASRIQPAEVLRYE